jgi:hypothetical protein
VSNLLIAQHINQLVTRRVLIVVNCEIMLLGRTHVIVIRRIDVQIVQPVNGVMGYAFQKVKHVPRQQQQILGGILVQKNRVVVVKVNVV